MSAVILIHPELAANVKALAEVESTTGLVSAWQGATRCHLVEKSREKFREEDQR